MESIKQTLNKSIPNFATIRAIIKKFQDKLNKIAVSTDIDDSLPSTRSKMSDLKRLVQISLNVYEALGFVV